MKVVEDIMGVVLLVIIFLISGLLLVSSLTQQTVQEIKITQQNEQSDRFDSDLNTLFKISEPQTDRALGELVSLYAAERRKDPAIRELTYGNKTIEIDKELKELLDLTYGAGNYYFEVKDDLENVEITFVIDGSGSTKEMRQQLPQTLGQLQTSLLGVARYLKTKIVILNGNYFLDLCKDFRTQGIACEQVDFITLYNYLKDIHSFAFVPDKNISTISGSTNFQTNDEFWQGMLSGDFSPSSGFATVNITHAQLQRNISLFASNKNELQLLLSFPNFSTTAVGNVLGEVNLSVSDQIFVLRFRKQDRSYVNLTLLDKNGQQLGKYDSIHNSWFSWQTKIDLDVGARQLRITPPNVGVISTSLNASLLDGLGMSFSGGPLQLTSVVRQFSFLPSESAYSYRDYAILADTDWALGMAYVLNKSDKNALNVLIPVSDDIATGSLPDDYYTYASSDEYKSQKSDYYILCDPTIPEVRSNNTIKTLLKVINESSKIKIYPLHLYQKIPEDCDFAVGRSSMAFIDSYYQSVALRDQKIKGQAVISLFKTNVGATNSQFNMSICNYSATVGNPATSFNVCPKCVVKEVSGQKNVSRVCTNILSRPLVEQQWNNISNETGGKAFRLQNTADLQKTLLETVQELLKPTIVLGAKKEGLKYAYARKLVSPSDKKQFTNINLEVYESVVTPGLVAIGTNLTYTNLTVDPVVSTFDEDFTVTWDIENLREDAYVNITYFDKSQPVGNQNVQKWYMTLDSTQSEHSKKFSMTNIPSDTELNLQGTYTVTVGVKNAYGNYDQTARTFYRLKDANPIIYYYNVTPNNKTSPSAMYYHANILHRHAINISDPDAIIIEDKLNTSDTWKPISIPSTAIEQIAPYWTRVFFGVDTSQRSGGTYNSSITVKDNVSNTAKNSTKYTLPAKKMRFLFVPMKSTKVSANNHITSEQYLRAKENMLDILLNATPLADCPQQVLVEYVDFDKPYMYSSDEDCATLFGTISTFLSKKGYASDSYNATIAIGTLDNNNGICTLAGMHPQGVANPNSNVVLSSVEYPHVVAHELGHYLAGFFDEYCSMRAGPVNDYRCTNHRGSNTNVKVGLDKVTIPPNTLEITKGCNPVFDPNRNDDRQTFRSSNYDLFSPDADDCCFVSCTSYMGCCLGNHNVVGDISIMGPTNAHQIMYGASGKRTITDDLKSYLASLSRFKCEPETIESSPGVVEPEPKECGQTCKRVCIRKDCKNICTPNECPPAGLS